MTNIQTSVEPHPTEFELRQIITPLLAFNTRAAPPENYQDLTILSRLGDEIIGGLIAYTHWHWLYIQQLWVAEPHRRQGLGAKLLRTAEQEAIARHCLHAHCDTYDFQALPFYQKQGYKVFAHLEDYPPNHTRYFLSKRNLPSR